jgi:hypothetical protein
MQKGIEIKMDGGSTKWVSGSKAAAERTEMAAQENRQQRNDENDENDENEERKGGLKKSVTNHSKTTSGQTAER